MVFLFDHIVKIRLIIRRGFMKQNHRRHGAHLKYIQVFFHDPVILDGGADTFQQHLLFPYLCLHLFLLLLQQFFHIPVLIEIHDIAYFLHWDVHAAVKQYVQQRVDIRRGKVPVPLDGSFLEYTIPAFS